MKRFDRGYIYCAMVSSLASSLVLTLFLAFEEWEEGVFSTGVLVGLFLAIYAAHVVYAILYVRCSGYALTDTELRCRTGVLGRKTAVLSYQKVHAVNKMQSLPQRIFGIATLTVDSGATGNAFHAEISIVEKAAVVDALMQEIRTRQGGGEIQTEPGEGENLYRFDSKLKLVYSALSLCGSLFVMLLLLMTALVLIILAAPVVQSIGALGEMELWVAAFFLGGVALVLVGLLSLIQGICMSFVAYHKFRISRTRQGLEICYGLLNRQTNHFHNSRIKAVKIQCGPVKRLFGFVTVGLEVVGYGNADADEENQKTAVAPGMLLPLCRARDVNAALERIVPGYVPREITHRPKSWWAFVLWPAAQTLEAFAFALTVGTAMLMAFGVSDWILELVSAGLLAALALNLLGLLVKATLEWRNTGIGFDGEGLTVATGALLRKRTVIRWKDVVGIERITTPVRQSRGICSCRIHFFSNAMTNTVDVKNLDAALVEKLEACIRD